MDMDKDTALADLEKKLEEKTMELRSARDKLSSLEGRLEARNAENARLRQVIHDRENSLSWRLSQHYGRLFGPGSFVTRALTAFFGKILNISDPGREKQYDPGELMRFLEKNTGKDICLVVSGTKYVENEGQRTLRIAQGLADKGYIVIFASWRWSKREEFEDGPVRAGVFQIPFNLLVDKAGDILGCSGPGTKIFLVEYPHPALFEAIGLANSNGWTTIYDIMDDWEAFHKAGQATWYDRGFEAFLLKNSDIVTVVSPGLADKIKNEFGYVRSRIVPNGVSPGALEGDPDRPLRPDLPKGAMTIGYFGHLTSAWFDWDLVRSTAKRHPEWIFHLIGYGYPEGLDLPENVLLPGRVEPKALSGFVSGWDVAIIPFKKTEITLSADPIKVYEYLYFRVPVVATGFNHIGKYPYVWIADTPGEFERDIITAAKAGVAGDTIADFIRDNTWEKRVQALVDLLPQARQTCSLKRV
jgi:glycosyltransferase involved in cell wall biosynthesis